MQINVPTVMKKDQVDRAIGYDLGLMLPPGQSVLKIGLFLIPMNKNKSEVVWVMNVAEARYLAKRLNELADDREREEHQDKLEGDAK